MGKAKYGRGLAREIVAAVNLGLIHEPFTVEDERRLIAMNGWPVPDTMIYPILEGGASDSHSPTHKKYFVRVSPGQFRLRDEYRSSKWR